MSTQAQRAFSTEFKERIALRLAAGERLATLAEELGIRRKLLYQWRHAYRKQGIAEIRNSLRASKQSGKSLPSTPVRGSSGASRVK
jgi:transposase-like protein